MRSDRARWTGVGALLLAAVLTGLVAARWRPLMSYDEELARGLHPYAVTHPGVTRLMRVLTDWVWDPWTMRALAALACFWLWRRGERRRALLVALTAIVVASVVQQGLKALLGRERPVWPDPVDSADYAAYPSGHAMTAAVVCGLLLWLLPRTGPGTAGRRLGLTAWAVALISVLGVGFTRVYLGVHWPSDVVGGWLLGAALVLALVSVRLPAARRAAGGPTAPDASRPARTDAEGMHRTPIVVHRISASGGRQVTFRAAGREAALGVAHSDADVIEFLRRAEVPDPDEIVLGEDSALITWEADDPHVYEPSPPDLDVP
ncbi:phosphatase PAP2 family protein [Streptomyces sp. APSN-46.1]|uniref:phosphatase PAP2 family protein n=1 Tax=Streptomyces sp. APSN-46.1 TaxID=2929049 RepID=UPI0035AB7D7D